VRHPIIITRNGELKKEKYYKAFQVDGSIKLMTLNQIMHLDVDTLVIEPDSFRE
jgi:pentose-5-phosphate-3-epimerase